MYGVEGRRSDDSGFLPKRWKMDVVNTYFKKRERHWTTFYAEGAS